jgi:flagellar assembly protein FliH
VVAVDALIRAPRVAAQRLKLGAAGAAAPAQRAEPAPVDLQAQRREVEARLRAELMTELRAELRAEADKALQAEREAARQRGFAEGREQGRAAAAEAAQRQRDEAAAALQALLGTLGEAVDAALQSLQARAADIAFVAVARIAGEKALPREFVLGQVETVLRHAGAQQPLAVRLHPDDAALLRELLGTAPRLEGRAVELVDDETLALHGCIVDTPLGCLDATLPTQLRRLRDVLDGRDRELS